MEVVEKVDIIIVEVIEDTMNAYFCYRHRCCTLRLCVGCFIYFKFIPVFFNGCF